MAPTLRPQKAKAPTQRRRAPTGTARRHGASSRTVNRTDAVDDDSSSVGSRMSTRSQRAGNASRKDDDSQEGDLSDHIASESLVGDLWNPIDDTRPVEDVDNEFFDNREYVIREDEDGVPIMEPTGRTLYQASAAFQSDSDESYDPAAYRVTSRKGVGGGRPLIPGLTPKPDISCMSKEDGKQTLKEWRVKRKSETDALRRKISQSSLEKSKIEGPENISDNNNIVFTGDVSPVMRTMVQVSTEPLQVGHNFPTRDIMLLRVLEEANLYGVYITISRSDSLQFLASGNNFLVTGVWGIRKGWNITNAEYPCSSREIPLQVHDSNMKEDDLVEGNPDDGEESADDDPTPKSRKLARRHHTTPIRSVILIPIVRDAVAQRPNLSNKDMMQLLKLYVKPLFLTRALLQNTRAQARFEIFGNPNDNVKCVQLLQETLSKLGHQVQLLTSPPGDVLFKLEEIIVEEEKAKNRKANVKWSSDDKIAFIDEWKRKHASMLDEHGLGQTLPDGVLNKFVTGILVSVAPAANGVPLLQTVYQADACHLEFGKYTMFTIYGIGANNNTFPVAMAILFGNENLASWVKFFTFAVNTHPCLNDAKVTIISDKDKGLMGAIAEVLPKAVNFMCSYHRRKNITIQVRGGSGAYSCLWFYNLLMRCSSHTVLEGLKVEHAMNMDDKALRYLNKVNDHEQYPASRCAMGDDIYMYGRSSSSSAEAMNKANSMVRERHAVDCVNAVLLWLKLEKTRYEEHRTTAWEWNEVLTPYAKKKCEESFRNVNHCLYNISILQHDERFVFHVKRHDSQQLRTCYFMKEEVKGSVFGGCSCSFPKTQGWPCHHMIAVVKSTRITDLTMSNCMPYWWMTDCWREQYPEDSGIEYLDMETLTNTLPREQQTNNPYRYCPPYAAPKKRGRPKDMARIPSPIEKSSRKKRKVMDKKQGLETVLESKTAEDDAP